MARANILQGFVCVEDERFGGCWGQGMGPVWAGFWGAAGRVASGFFLLRRRLLPTGRPWSFLSTAFCGGMQGFSGNCRFRRNGKCVERASFVWQILPLTQRRQNRNGRSLLMQQRQPLRDSGRFSRSITAVSGHRRMQPEDVRKDVSFHQFFYRLNPDKTIDAICAFCYATAATAENPADLQMRERMHRCPRKPDKQSA